MIPYAKHNIVTDDVIAVARVLQSDRLTQGPQVPAFEEAFAEKCGAKYAVAVSSGTAALHLAYLACGVGPGKTVLTSPVSFVATANAALYCGADVGFADVNPLTGHLELVPEGMEYVVPVTLGGQWPRDLCGELTNHHVLDQCHGPYAFYEELPNHHAACFSLHPCKHIAAGEGGVVVTNDWGVALACRAGRDHGWTGCSSATRERRAETLGFNYRLDEMSAALALSQLQHLDENIEQRRAIARGYDTAFTNLEVVPHSEHSARHLYQILVDHRDTVMERLAQRGIGTQVHYSPIIPLQPYYRERFGYKEGDFPNAERYAARTLSLPLYPTLTEQEQDFVIENVLEVIHEVSVL